MNRQESETSHSAASLILIIIVVPALYVLSVGPVGVVAGQPHSVGYLPNFYAPLNVLFDTPLEKPLNDYISWWWDAP